MVIDKTKSAFANVLALANTLNNAAVSETQVTVGIPQLFAEDGNARNTQVVFTAIDRRGFEGTFNLKYTRLGVFSGVVDAASLLPLTVAPNATPAEIKAQLVTLLGLVETEVTVSDLVLPEDEATPGSITLSAIDNSLLYVGLESVELVFPDTDVALDSVWTNDQADGFTAAS